MFSLNLGFTFQTVTLALFFNVKWLVPQSGIIFSNAYTKSQINLIYSTSQTHLDPSHKSVYFHLFSSYYISSS